jgi:hypothetical protein
MEYIQGEKFKYFANNKNVFYKHTHEVDYFFKNEAPNTPFILISHNSDGNVLENAIRPIDASFSLAPPNLIKWFAQNINYKHDKLQSLPIGLENSEWFIETKKRDKLKEIVKTSKKLINLVYMNHNIKNNPPERQPLYDILSNKSYVTTHYGSNGINFDNYLYNLYNHCFMICPPGNGIGVHQPWEAMYINTIPIQKRYIDNSYYADLPICFVNDWSELENEEFLRNEYVRIKHNSSWNLEKLNFNYWKKLIETEIEKL